MPLSVDPGVADLEACREALRGGSKSFDAAAKLLPTRIRQPAVALYAFCREADDLIDADGGSLDTLRRRLDLIYAGCPIDQPADRGMAWIVDRFAMPRVLLEALLEGFAWDSAGRRYQNLSELRDYAMRVAGTVGAMMAVLMGVRDRARLAAAIDLGVAMQLSNIARDVGEDARNGRLYLPLEWLLDAGIDPGAFLADPAHSPALARIVRRLLAVAEMHYRRAAAGIGRLPVGCRLGIGAASLLYAEIGREVARRGMDSVSGRAVVGKRRKAVVLAMGLPRMAVPLRSLSASVVPEGAFLINAVVAATPVRERSAAACPWWDLVSRVRWTIDLFERMEQREWMRS